MNNGRLGQHSNTDDPKCTCAVQGSRKTSGNGVEIITSNWKSTRRHQPQTSHTFLPQTTPQEEERLLFKTRPAGEREITRHEKKCIRADSLRIRQRGRLHNTCVRPRRTFAIPRPRAFGLFGPLFRGCPTCLRPAQTAGPYTRRKRASGPPVTVIRLCTQYTVPGGFLCRMN